MVYVDKCFLPTQSSLGYTETGKLLQKPLFMLFTNVVRLYHTLVPAISRETMGQKQSSSLADCEIDMMNRTDLSSHFTNTMRSYQPDECFQCAARLEDNNLFDSNAGKSSGDDSAVRCRPCRVCQSTNIIFVKFREVTTSSPRSFRVHPTAHVESQPFSLDGNHNNMLHHQRTQPSNDGRSSTFV
ncbi:hypothetical protein OUZ56_022995 [Daphnia magna]|uniref:Uncharacterized protein n=1 Tax=Daphnia magna TaxID=35525 RepID=A0ABR0AY33_9CRUS|nr:hypothetical protein OUZ56_022995 [Daphnia magna]